MPLPNPGMTFTPFDILTAAELNDIVENIEALVAGTAFGTGAIPNAAVASGYSASKLDNPYKFSAYRNAAQNATSSFSKINLDTEIFDTGGNFNNSTTYRFVAPVNGFYQFNAQASTGATVTLWIASIFKNGVEYARGNKSFVSGNFGSNVSDLIKLLANDYIELFVIANATVALEAGAGAPHPSMSGFMVSAT